MKILRVISTLAFVIFPLVFSYAAEAPSQRELESELRAVSSERQKLFSDYKAGELMMENARLKDGPLKEQEDQLKAKLKALMDKPKAAIK